MKLVAEVRYRKANEARIWADTRIVELTEEITELESKRSSKNRRAQIEQLTVEIRNWQRVPQARTVSAIFAEVNEGLSQRIGSCEETIAKFFVGCQEDSIAYTVGWHLGGVIGAEYKKAVYAQMRSQFERTSIDEWLKILDWQEKGLREEVFRHAACGGSKSTSRCSNLVGSLKAQASAELLSDSMGGFAYIRSRIGRLTDAVVWEDRDLSESGS